MSNEMILMLHPTFGVLAIICSVWVFVETLNAKLERFVSQRRVACPQDSVARVIDPDLLLQRLLNIDIADDAEALLFQRVHRAGHGRIERE